MAVEPSVRRARGTWPILAGAVLLAGIVGAFLYGRQPSAPLASAPQFAARPTLVTPTPPPVTVPSNPAPPSFDIVRVTPEGSTVIAGRAEPGAQVIVRDGETEIGRTQADQHGQFVLIPQQTLTPGGRELTLAARGAEGPEIKAPGSVLVVVPAPATPQAAVPAAPAVALLVPPVGAPRILQGPKPAGSAGKLSLDTVDYDDKGEIRFSGSARPTTPLRVYVDNNPVGEATTDAKGQWTLTPDAAVPPGLHQFRVDQLNASGQVASRVELPFQRTTLASPADLPANKVIVQPGENLWRIARHAYGAGIRYTVIYLANRDQIRDPRRIYPGQVFATPQATP